MHILYLHQYFVPPNGAGGTRSYEMARRMVRAGHHITLVTSSAYFPDSYGFERTVTEIMIDGIRVLAVKVPYSNHLSFRARMRAFAVYVVRSLWVTLSQKNVDIVFATSTPLTIAIPAILAKWRYRVPMTFEVRDLWPELPVAIGAISNPIVIRAAKALERLAYYSSTRVVALSPGMRDGIVKAGYPSDRTYVIPNSCDIGLFRNISEAEVEAFLNRHPYLSSGPVVLYAGTFGPINGVRYLVDLAVRMRSINPNVRFVAVGDGRERASTEAYADQLGVLGENVWMLPLLPKKQVAVLLKIAKVAMSLFIDLPPMWSNSANKFFDALASGTPVMINYKGWQRDLLAETGAGIAVAPDNPALAAEQLNVLLTDRARYRTAEEAARKLADEVFNRDKLAGELLHVLEEAAAE